MTGRVRARAAVAAAMMLAGTLLGGSPSGSSPVVVVSARTQARAVLRDVAGSERGGVSFTQEASRVRVQVAASGLSPGWHGFHVHAVGDCTVGDAANPFTAAGGHLGSGVPANQNHSDHDGDMPLLYVNAEGLARATFTTDSFTVEQVLDARGDASAVIVHALADNYANIPARYASSAIGAPATGPDAATLSTGDSGSRQQCGRMEPGSITIGQGGYWLLQQNGGVRAVGEARPLGGVESLRLARPVVDIEASPSRQGYWLAASDGGVFAFGDATFAGSTGALRLNQPVVGLSAAPGQVSAVLVDSAGREQGAASFTPDGSEIRVDVAARGLSEGWHGFHVHTTGTCAVGDPANAFTAAGGHLGSGPPANQNHSGHDGDMPLLYANRDGLARASFRTDNFTMAQLLDADGSAVIVHAAPDNYANIPTRYQQVAGAATGPDTATLATGDSGGRQRCGLAQRTGSGYRLVASDGGVFAFGDARFLGSTGAIRLNQPVVGMATTPSGQGYWMVARDGGIFAFGDAPFLGSTGAVRLNQPVVGMASTPSGRGYWLLGGDGGVFAFGDAAFHGTVSGSANPMVALISTPTGGGYSLVDSGGSAFAFGDAQGLAFTAGPAVRSAAGATG